VEETLLVERQPETLGETLESGRMLRSLSRLPPVHRACRP